MTILAITDDHVVEFHVRILTIARHSDGKCLNLTGNGIAGQFRSSVKTHGAERATEVFLMMCKGQEWMPLYKPGRTPRVMPAEAKQTPA